jgi:hypothetical protein
MGMHRKTHILISYDTDHIENDASSSSSTVACILCHGNVSTQPLPSTDRRGYTYRYRLMRGIYKVAVEMGSGAMVYILNFIKFGSGIRKLIGGEYTDTQRVR